MRKNNFTSLVLTLVFGIFIGWQGSVVLSEESKIGYNSQANLPSGSIDTKGMENSNAENMEMFWYVWELLNRKYVDSADIEITKGVYGAIKGMVASLEDPYTIFMDPEETNQFEDSLHGFFQGIGAELTVENGNLTIVSPLKGTPAEKAGLLPKDIIYKVDDQYTAEMTLFEAIMKIRGQEGTEVVLSIVRENSEEPFEVAIKRANIDVPSVSWEMKEGQIAYLAVNQFSDTTTTEFKKAAREILLENPKGIVLDLRFNGGGYLEGAVDVLSELIDGKKKAVIIKKKYEEDNEVLYTVGNAHLGNISLVVLVNEGTASAAEIVAGAIQDYKRGLVIGKQSFGKGKVQEINMLPDGSSLRITFAKWNTPLDRNIDKMGITPDRIIEITDEDVKQQRDPQLEEAIKYLENL